MDPRLSFAPRLAVLFLLALALSGCLTDDGPALPEVLEGTACQEHGMVFPAPEVPVLPPGFQPVPMDPVGLAPMAVLFAMECGHAGGGYAEMLFILPVEPSERHRRDGAQHAIILEAASTSADRLDTLAAWGVPASAMTVQMAWTQGDSWTGSTTADAWTHIQLDTLAGGTPDPVPAGTSRLFALDAGRITGTLDVDWGPSIGHGQGLGTVQGVPEGQASIGQAFHVQGPEYWVRVAPAPPAS